MGRGGRSMLAARNPALLRSVHITSEMGEIGSESVSTHTHSAYTNTEAGCEPISLP